VIDWLRRHTTTLGGFAAALVLFGAVAGGSIALRSLARSHPKHVAQQVPTPSAAEPSASPSMAAPPSPSPCDSCVTPQPVAPLDSPATRPSPVPSPSSIAPVWQSTWAAEQSLAGTTSFPRAVYDQARHEAFAVAPGSGGGQGEPPLLQWTWSGSTWTESTANGPIGRFMPSLAYDPGREVAVMFGGENSYGTSPMDWADTWEWNGTSWSQKQFATAPPARSEAGLVYDAARHVLLLFGGTANCTPGPCYNSFFGDTWTYDGSAWTQLHPAHSPDARAPGQLAYDAATGKVLLFGGISLIHHDDTWEWDGTDWKQVTSQSGRSPSVRSDQLMVYDPSQRVVVLFGGDGSPAYSDVWIWDGSSWWPATAVPDPPARFATYAAWDSDRGAVLIVGGETSSTGDSDAWEGSLHQA
jgi:hypothetical protein